MPLNVWVILIVAVGIISGYLVLTLQLQHRQAFRDWGERQSSIADDRARLVANWLRERRLDAEADSQSPEVQAYLSTLLASGDAHPQTSRRLLSHLALLNQTKDSYGYLGTYVLDGQARVVLEGAGSQEPPSQVFSGAGKALASGQLQIEWLPDGPGWGTLCIVSPVAGGNPRGGRLGAVALVVGLTESLFQVLTAEAVPTKTGESLLVDRSAGQILYRSPLRDVRSGRHTFPDHPGSAAHAALEGRRLFGEFIDYRGRTVLAAVRRIPGTALGLEAKIDADEAFAVFRRTATIQAGAGAFLFLAIAGIVLGYRRLIWSSEVAHRAAAFRRILESTPVGLVILDDANRILFVNPRTEQLFGYRREELTGRPFDVLVPGDQAIPDRGVILAGRADEVKAQARRKDGSLFPAELGFRWLEEGSDSRLNVAIRDVTERHQIQQNLERTKAQLQTLFNAGHDAVFVLFLADDPTIDRFVLVNDMACERLGYTREELLRLSLRDIHSPEALARLAYVGERLHRGGHCLFETEHITKDGRAIPVEVIVRTTEFAGRRAVLAVARDITDRKVSLARLEASERRYRRYVERNAAAFLRNSLDGRVLECNDAMVGILGYDSQEDLKSHSIFEVYQNPADRQTVEQLLRRDGHLNGYEVLLKKKNGTPIWALVNLTLVEDAGDFFIEGTGIDITVRKQMEKELRTIAALVEASSDFIGFASMDGKILFVNQAGRNFVGLEPDADVSGGHMLDYVAGSNREFVMNTVLPAVLRDGRWSGETQFRNFKTGAVIPMWQSAFCITDPETGKPIANGTVCRDLTERKREEDEMRAARLAAESGNRAKSRFLANMSHEIRTPMNGVLGMARLLLASSLTREQRRYAEVILSSGHNLLALVNDILDLSKIEAGRVALETLDFELAPVIYGALQTIEMDAHSKGLAFTTALSPGVPRNLRGDPARLRQVIVNLAGNAVKFTSAGSVGVQVEMLSRLERYITLRFHFTDTGIGISEEQRKDLFSPFAQGDESTTRKFGGTGLGLSIARQLVELMGGQIGFDSQPGQGSHFWFTVLLEEAAAEAVPAEGSTAGIHVCRDSAGGHVSSPKHGKILVAEDHPVNREVLVALLHHLGYGAGTAENGREAIRGLQSERYDLVLMDCQMPEMDGYEATRLIRDPSTGALNPRIPIVAVTASAMAGDREKCIAAGMDDYLSKPVEPEPLARVLARWLRGPAPGSGSVVPEQPAIPDETCAFDHASLLKRVMGNHVIAEKVMAAFLQAAPDHLNNLRRHVGEQDVSAARREAHSLKGAAGTVSAPALRSLALELERAAVSSEWNRITELLPQVGAQIDRLRVSIEAHQRQEALECIEARPA